MINNQTILRTGDRIQNLKDHQEYVIHLVVEKSGQSSFEGVVKDCQSIIANDGIRAKEMSINEISILKGVSHGHQ